MKLHTLGPTGTDSAAAAAQYCQTHPALQVAYHPSFEELYANLTKYRGDQLLVPAAYQSSAGLSWGQLHYRYLTALTLVDGFLYELAPLVLAELPTRANQRAYVHPANADLLRQLIPTAKICLCPSKITAADRFLADGRYVITSQAALPAHLPPADSPTVDGPDAVERLFNQLTKGRFNANPYPCAYRPARHPRRPR